MFMLTSLRRRVIRYEKDVWVELGAVLSEHESSIVSLSFSPNGKTLASASRDGSVKLWDVQGEETKFALKLNHPALTVSFSPDGNWLAIGGHNGTLNFCQVSDGKVVKTLELQNEVVQSVAFAPDGKSLVVGSGVWSSDERRFSSGKVRIWSMDDENFVNEWTEDNSPISSVAFSPEGKFVAAGIWSGQVKVWRVSDGALNCSITAHSGWVKSVVFSPDSKLIAAPGFSYQPLGSWWETPVPVFNVDSGSLSVLLRAGVLGFIRGHRGPVNAVAFSPDGQLLVSGGNDKTVKVWHIEGRLLCSLEGHLGLVNAVAFSPDGQTVASADSAGFIFLWRVLSDL